MRRVLTTNLLLLLFLNFLVKPFWIFGIDRTVQNTLGAGEYGLFYTLFNFSLIFNILLDLGITNFNNREISRHPQMLGKYFSNIVGIKMALGLLYAGFTLVSALVLGYGKDEVGLLVLLIINQFISSFILYLRSNISGSHAFRMDSVLSVLDKAIMILLCGLMLWTQFFPLKLSIVNFVLVQTISYILTAIAAFGIVVKMSGKIHFRFDVPFILTMLKSSFPYALLILLMTVYGRVDTVIIERMLPEGDTAAGIYAQAFRLLDAVNMFPFLFASLLLPMFSRMIRGNEKMNSFVGFSSILLLVPVIAVAIPTFFYRHQIVDALYHEHTAQSSLVLGLLMGSFIFISIGYIFGTLITALGNLKQLNIISAMTVVISITAQLILVSEFGITGAAWGNMLTNGFVALLTIWLAVKYFKFQISLFKFVRIGVFIVLSLISTALFFNYLQNFLLGYIASLLIILLISIMLKLISVKEIASFFLKESTLD